MRIHQSYEVDEKTKLELSNLCIGDFVRLGDVLRPMFSFDDIAPVAIVRGKGKAGDRVNVEYETGHLEIVHYEKGKPMKDRYGTGMKGFVNAKVSREEAVHYFRLLSEHRKLRVALELSSITDLEHKVDAISGSDSDPTPLLKTTSVVEGTNIYLVRGRYSNMVEKAVVDEIVRMFATTGKNIQPIILEKALSVETVQKMLREEYPSGFARIVPSIIALEGGAFYKKELFEYEVVAVPESAFGLVGTPLRM